MSIDVILQSSNCWIDIYLIKGMHGSTDGRCRPAPWVNQTAKEAWAVGLSSESWHSQLSAERALKPWACTLIRCSFPFPNFHARTAQSTGKKRKKGGGAIKVGIRQVRATRAEDHYTDRLRMQSWTSTMRCITTFHQTAEDKEKKG